MQWMDSYLNSCDTSDTLLEKLVTELSLKAKMRPNQTKKN